MQLTGPKDTGSAVESALVRWNDRRGSTRIWDRDASLWPEGAAAWLGWLDVAETGPATLQALARRVSQIAPTTTDVLLIGMGGSSLAPEVMARTLPRGASGKRVRILDSTEPAFVHRAFAETNWPRTLMCVASKSGTTLEPDILFAAALAQARIACTDDVARRIVVITDPGSRLETQARTLGAADVFRGERAIGGRFSALSPFGLVPAALHGIDLQAFMESAHAMATACRADSATNPGAQLGAFMATTARAGRDKLTLLLPPSLAALGAWIEQLVAESTGKHGIAVLPIDGEQLGDVAVYGEDRAFVHVRDMSTNDQLADSIRKLDVHPVLTIDVASPAALAGEFFRWEFATAVAGSILGVNPFDQPDVEAAKIATRARTEAIERGASLPSRTHGSLEDIAALLSSIGDGDYFAMLAFLPMFDDVRARLERIRMQVRDARRVATTLGFGPRYLHSTGQAFKGGPPSGVFLVLTCDSDADVDVPGRTLTFADVVAAQAAGDHDVLVQRGRRALHVHLHGDLQHALGELEAAVAGALND